MKIFIFTGAGISAESGLQTFRATDGLWENHRVEDVATPSGWYRDKELVLRFYNQRRKAVHDAQPNAAHKALAKLEKKHEVTIVTQNIDDLHERAGSTNVIHLHGEIFKVCSENDFSLIQEWNDDVNLGDLGKDGAQLRPWVVWFGENILRFEEACRAATEADVSIVIGTSAQVYPAASLINIVPETCWKYFIDPNIPFEHYARDVYHCVNSKATIGVPIIVQSLLK